MSNQTIRTNAPRPQETDSSLHSAIYQSVSKARQLSIDVLGSNASIAHAITVARQNKSLLIGIHDGTPASVQEAFAVAIRCLAEDHDVVVLRRNFKPNSVIPEGMALYGTGGEYDHGKDRYDPQKDDFITDIHHDGTSFTPCGLAWRHHGNRVLNMLGCPLDILRTVHAEIMNGIVRDIDHEAAKEAPYGIWTVAKAVRDIDHEENTFDESVAAFTKMAMIAKRIMLGIITESILRIAGEEVQIGEADMDFIWEHAFSCAEELNGNVMSPRPKNSWAKHGYKYISNKKITLSQSHNAFEGFNTEIIPTLMGEASENYGMTVYKLSQIFGLRYADEFYKIAVTLLDAFSDRERRYCKRTRR